MKDQRRTEEAKREDAAFYEDQRSERKMTMTVQQDEEFELKAWRRQGRFEKVKHLNDKKNTKKVPQKEKRTVQKFDRSQKSTDKKSKDRAQKV